MERVLGVKRLPQHSRWGHLAALGLFVALTLAMLYPYPIKAGTHLRDLGDPLEYAWVLGYSAHKLLTAPLQLYDGNIFYPFIGSLAYSDSTLASTILALPILLTTDNPVLASNLLILLSFVLAGFGTYLLVADLTGSRLVGVVAGVVFAFNPYRMDHLSQIPNVASHWIPFVFLALHRFLDGRSRRWAAGFALFLSLQLLSSFYYAYAVGLAVAVYLFGFFLLHPRRLSERGTVLPIFAATAVAGGLLIAAALPYFDISQRYEMRRTLTEAAAFAARPQSYLAVPDFNRTWGRIDRLVKWGEGERRLFPGLIAVALATAGLVKGKPRRQAVLFAFVGAFAFLLSLGPSPKLSVPGSTVSLPFPMPYQLLFEYLPGFQSMRVPARFAIVVMLAIGVLAGLGVACIARRLTEVAAGAWGATRAPYPQAALATLVTLVLLAEYASFPIPMQPIATGQAIPDVYKWLREQPDKQVIVELPIDNNALHQAPYAYFSTYHHWTLVNGWRSFEPPGYREMAGVLNTFPSVDSIAALANLGVKYVILHSDMVSEADLIQRELRLRQHAGQVREVQRFGTDHVYEVSAPPASVPLRASVASSCLAVAGRDYPASLTLDGEGRQLIALPDVPERLTISARWLSQDGKRFEQEFAAEAPLPVFQSAQAIDLPLVAPPDPGTYSLTLDVTPPITADIVGPDTRVVKVESAQPDSPTAAERGLQVTAFDLPRKAAKSTDTITLRVNWQSRASHRVADRVFVNVYDANYRVWTVHSWPALPEFPSGELWCEGQEVLDVREVRIRPETPPGYYWVELGLMDPVTGRRQLILDPEGKPVDKITTEPLRISDRPVYTIDNIAPEHPERANLADQVQLLGWTKIAERPRPGETLTLALYWRALRPPSANYTVFVHLYDGDGRLVAQHDGIPGSGAWPTSLWQPEDVVEDEVGLSLPPDLPAGEYTLAIGMYDPTTLRRLPIVEGASLGDDRVSLGRLSIAP